MNNRIGVPQNQYLVIVRRFFLVNALFELMQQLVCHVGMRHGLNQY